MMMVTVRNEDVLQLVGEHLTFAQLMQVARTCKMGRQGMQYASEKTEPVKIECGSGKSIMAAVRSWPRLRVVCVVRKEEQVEVAERVVCDTVGGVYGLEIRCKQG